MRELKEILSELPLSRQLAINRRADDIYESMKRDEEMTLTQAARVLCDHEHNESVAWYPRDGGVANCGQYMTEFEAIAIAEKYEREAT